MKKILMVLILVCSYCLLNSCGGGTSTPAEINVTLTPTGTVPMDVSQTLPLTANASTVGGSSFQGFDWSLTCGGGNCGTITSHTANGVSATYSAPAAPPSGPVTIMASLTGHSNVVGATVTVSTPPTVATTGAITPASLGVPYSLQLAANGGAGGLTWALGGGTSLPDTLSLSGGMITGTPTGTTGTFNFSVRVTDSGNPPVTSPDVQLSLAVAEPSISVSLSQTSAFVGLNGSTNFIATVLYDKQNGNVDWSLSLNGQPCTVAVCGSLSSVATASGAPITYKGPASAPPASITLTATTVDGSPPATSSAAITITAHGFTATGSMAAARSEHTATLLQDGRVLVTGGLGSNNAVLATAELFDPTSGTFTSTGSMETPRRAHIATLLADGRVLITGGADATGNPLSSAEIFDPATGIFSTTGSMETTRSGHTATLLGDGKVLVAGGDQFPIAPVGPNATAELFDPTTGIFSPTGSMQGQRTGHTATLLRDGKVLFVGGSAFVFPGPPFFRGVWESVQTAALFDPGSGTFTPTGSLQSGRTAHTATLQNDGTVLVTGGKSIINHQYGLSYDYALSTSERFDPAKGAFAPTGSMATPRIGHSATLLSDGTVMVAGGTDGMKQLATTEIYDPVSGTFSRTGDTISPRAYHTATLLKAGVVLVTGGVDGTGNPLATTELYR